MQFIARLHTPRTTANRLQAKLYASSLESAEYFAKGLLAPEPLGAWAEIARITNWQSGTEVLVKVYMKEIVNNEVGITEIAVPSGTDAKPGQSGSGAVQEPGGRADAEGK